MTNPAQESSGQVAEGSVNGFRGDDTPLSEADILVEQVDSQVDSALEATAAVADSAPDEAAISEQTATLSVEDVLQSGSPDAGIGLTFETVGVDTVVRIDTQVAGTEIVVSVVTVEGVAGLTLQQLLESNQVLT